MADVGTLAFLGQTFWRNPSDSDLIPHSEQVKVKKLKSESEKVKKWKSESEQVKKWKWMADVGALAFLGQKTFWRNPKRWPDSTHWASELHLNWVGGAFVSFVDKLRLRCGLVHNKWIIVDFFTLCICVFVCLWIIVLVYLCICVFLLGFRRELVHNKWQTISHSCFHLSPSLLTRCEMQTWNKLWEEVKPAVYYFL